VARLIYDWLQFEDYLGNVGLNTESSTRQASTRSGRFSWLPTPWPHKLLKTEGFTMAQEKTFRDVQGTSSEIVIRKIGVKDLWQALKEGLSRI